MVMTEARPEVSIMGEMVEVHCPNPIVIRGVEQPCDRLALRVTREMFAMFPKHVALKCDKCDMDIPWSLARTAKSRFDKDLPQA